MLLYDETTPEKAPHTSMIALRFIGNSFAVFLDNLEDEQGKKCGLNSFMTMKYNTCRLKNMKKTGREK